MRLERWTLTFRTAADRELLPPARDFNHHFDRRRTLRLILLLSMFLAVSACHSTLPTYPRLDAGQTLALMHRRATAIRSLSGVGRLTLTGPDGASVQLDAVLVARLPDDWHVRAWKMSQTALDITLTRDGLWIAGPSQTRHNDPSAPQEQGDPLEAVTAEGWKEAMLLVAGCVDERTWSIEEPMEGWTFRLRRSQESTEPSLTCEVDRGTLTLRQCRVTAAAGDNQLTLSLDRYRRAGDIAMPGRIVMESPHGVIAMHLDSIEVNGELPDQAFVPPARAVRRP